MNCTSIHSCCAAAGNATGQPQAGRGRSDGQRAIVRLLAQLGEQLFHYRLVRAELIERALQANEQGKRS